jgi:transposase
MFAVSGMHVLAVTRLDPDRRARTGRLRITVETDPGQGGPVGCPACGVLAVGHGRRVHKLQDAPCFALPVEVWWRKRLWRCLEADCPVATFSERHELAPPRAKLTSRAVAWAIEALRWDDTSVSALARHLGVDWHTLMDAITAGARADLERPGRLEGVHVLGVDEHIWRPTHHGRDRAVTSMVDLTRDQHGQLHARLLDVVPGRSGSAYATWLQAQPAAFRAGITHAALDPFRGYANAIRDQLDDAVPVLDAFHVVKLGGTAVDEVRRRVQQDQLGRRGHKQDPLYRIRRLLLTGIENLTDRQRERLKTGLDSGDPDWHVTIAWQSYQQLRAIYHTSGAADGRRRAEQIITTFPTCPIPEIARLGRTLRSWRTHVLAYFDVPEATGRVSNGGTEAVNLIIEKTRRIAHGFRNFHNYRLRILLAADGSRPYRREPPTHA